MVFQVFLHPRDQTANVLGFQDTITKTGPVHLQEYHTPHFLHFYNLLFTPPTEREKIFEDHVSKTYKESL